MFVVPRLQIVFASLIIAAAIPLHAAGNGEPARISAGNLAAPLSFERNQGQADPSVQFMARGSASTILLRRSDVIIYSGEAAAPVRMRLVGGNPAAAVAGDDLLPGTSNYFRGADERKWQRNVATYGKVRYEEAYPGIDAVFYGKDGQLEYDFVVNPGADPRTIRLGFSGQTGLSIDGSGDLLIATNIGTVRQTKPVIYQMIGGERRRVEGRYTIDGDHVAFAVGPYDKRVPLVIDPVLAYSSYFGGAGADHGNAIAVRQVSENTTHVYIAGSTTSLDILNADIKGAVAGYTADNDPKVSEHALRDVFVAKLIVSDTSVTVAYTTYLGHPYDPLHANDPAYHEATAIAVTPGGEVVVAGNAWGSFVTTEDAFQQLAKSDRDCFVAKLSADGRTLVYSTYLGGSGVDELRGVAVTASGEALVTGKTMPSGTVYDFPGAQIPDTDTSKPTLSGAERGKAEAFVVMLQADGKNVVYAHHLGGAEDDEGNGVAVAADGIAYVVGSTNSTDIPGTGGLQPVRNTGREGFVLKLGPGGSSIYFSYLGSPHDDGATAVTIDGAGALHVVGTGFAVGGSGYVIKIYGNPARGAALTFNQNFVPRAVAADSRGSSWIVGYGGSTGLGKGAEQMQPGHLFPVMPTPPAGHPADAFVAKVRYPVNPLTANYEPVIEYASHLGGNADDRATGVAVDGNDFAYIVGTTSSLDFPRSQNALQPNSAGAEDVFIRKTSGDVDQDAVPDSWEVPGEGIDIDRDGIIEIDLVALGATPNRKDLFLEVDYYVKASGHSHSPSEMPNGDPLALPEGQMPLDQLIAAFNVAPVPAPAWCTGCDAGIGLRFRGGPDKTDDVIVETAANLTIDNQPGDGDIDPDAIKHGTTCMTGKFLTAADRVDEETCAKKRDAWLQVAHYAIFGHHFADGSGGRGEFRGNDLVVANPIGGRNDRDVELPVYARSPAFGSKERAWADIQVYPFMHELGHNLGLSHGGKDHINCKPNYLSVMNYPFTYPIAVKTPSGIQGFPRRKLDFSHKALPSLRKDRLDEQEGVGGPAGWDVVFRAKNPAPNEIGHRAYLFMAPADGQIDWSHGRTGYSDRAVVSDVNYLGSPCGADTPSPLIGYDDWANLFFDFRSNPAKVNTFFALGELGEREPTQEEISLARVIGPHIVGLSYFNDCGQTVPATVIVEATVEDSDGNVTAVELFVDDVKVGQATVPPYRIPWDVTAAGTYVVEVKVADADGFSDSTAPQSIPFVPGNVPAISLVHPAAGTEATAPAAFYLVAETTTACGVVEFYDGAQLIGVAAGQYGTETGTVAHWYNMTAVAEGTHTFTARMRKGRVYISNPVTVEVNPNSLPQVVITTPQSGDAFRVPGSIAVDIMATDFENVAMASVEIFNGSTKIGDATKANDNGLYRFQWEGVPLGSYVLTVRATDGHGGVTTSAPVTVSVLTNVPPKVRIISPVDGETWRAPRRLNGAVQMSDPDGEIVNHKFYVDGVLQYDWPAPSAGFPWRSEERGIHVLTVSVTDNDGLEVTSAPVTVTVLPPCEAPEFAGIGSVTPAGDTFVLSWAPATRNCDDYPVMYNVYRSTDPAFVPDWDDSLWFCDVTDATTVVDEWDIERGVTYYYIARALHAPPGSCYDTAEDSNLVRLSGRLEILPVVTSLTLEPTAAPGGTPVEAVVTLDLPAPAGGIAVALASDIAEVTVPAAVSVAEGSSSATFDVTTTPVATPVSVTITATFGAAASAVLDVNPPELDAVLVSPESVVGGSASFANVTLTGPAPADGVEVSLSSSDSAAASVPPSVLIPSGSSQETAPVTTADVGAETTVTISATLDGTTREAELTVRPVDRAHVSALFADKSSPRVYGSAITWTPEVSGGVAPLEYRYSRAKSGLSSFVVQNWSTVNTYTWTPDADDAGTWTIEVDVRSAGTTATESSLSVSHVVTLGDPVVVTAFSANKPSPQVHGIPITWTAQVTGGVMPLQYRYTRTRSGTADVVQDWSTAATFSWTPAASDVGDWTVQVEVRSPHAAGPESSATAAHSVAPPGPVEITAVTASHASPQRPGTPVTWTAATTGGQAPVEYRYMYRLLPAGGWIAPGSWSADPSFTWSVGPTAVGTYEIKADARSAGGVASESTRTVMFEWGGALATLDSLVTDKPSPQRPGTAVTWTAQASGGEAPYEYHYLYRQLPSGGWINTGAWKTDPTFTWSVGASVLGTFEVKAEVRSAGATYADATRSVTFEWAASLATLDALVSDKPSPQRPGTVVTWTAQASGGAPPYQYHYLYRQLPSGGWIDTGAWKTDPTFTWSVGASVLGPFEVKAEVRSAGATYADANRSVTFEWAASLATLDSVVADKPSPQRPGTTVTWTAAASGGEPPYQYHYLYRQLPSGGWIDTGAWNTDPTFTWYAGVSIVGTYEVKAEVRSNGAAYPDATQSVTFEWAGSLATVDSLTTDLPSPQTVGTGVTWTASASAGLPPYEYYYKYRDISGNSWFEGRYWNASPSWTWIPPYAATWEVMVSVRSSGGTYTEATGSATLTVTTPP